MYLEYDGSIDKLRRRLFQKVLNRLALPQGATLLDYGCGPGDFLQEAQKRGIKAFGVDISDYSIKIARNRGLEVSKTTADELVKSGAKFDAIVVQSVIEHVDDATSMMRSLCRLLTSNGALVISSPTPGPYFWDDPTHIRPYTPRALLVLGELSEVHCEYLGYVFGFLLGMEIRNPLIFPAMNIIPLSLGSNIIAFFRAN